MDDRLVEQRATEVAVGKGDAVRVIDTFIKGFEQALAEGRVRIMDNPAETDTTRSRSRRRRVHRPKRRCRKLGFSKSK